MGGVLESRVWNVSLDWWCGGVVIRDCCSQYRARVEGLEFRA